MAWPIENKIHCIDLSRYNNGGERIDFRILAEANPELRLVINRVAGTTSGIDPTFPDNHDGALEAGFDVAAYVVANPAARLSDSLAMWEQGLSGKQPPAIFLDCELTGGKSTDVIRDWIRSALEEMKTRFPWATIAIYTASWFWSTNVGEVAWATAYPLWVAHYVFVKTDPSGKGAVANTYAELEAKLPYTDPNVPLLPLGWRQKSSTGDGGEPARLWQFTNKGHLDGLTGNVDLSLAEPAFYEQVWGSPPPEPEIEIEVIVPRGVRVIVTERGRSSTGG